MSLIQSLSIIIPVVAAISVAYTAHLQRRQMRQVELHRADAAVPLKPPPLKLWTVLQQFVTKNTWKYIFIFPIYDLSKGYLTPDQPATTHYVLNIGIDVIWISLAVSFAVDSVASKRSFQVVKILLDSAEKAVDEFKRKRDSEMSS